MSRYSNKFKYSETANQAYELVKRKILDSEFEPGSKLDERKICSEFGISRTPIREALNRLQQEGFLVRLPQIGYTIKLFSLKEIRELYEIRAILEVAAAKLALNNLSEEKIREFDRIVRQSKNFTKRISNIKKFITREGLYFHTLIGSLCGNETLSKILNNVIEKLSLIHRRLLENERTILSVEEHKEILKHLRKKEEKELEMALINHIESVKNYIIDLSLKKEEKFNI